MREWLRAADLRLAAELAVIGALVVAFILIGNAVGSGFDGFDEQILLAMRNTPDDPRGPRWFENAMMHLSALGSGAVTGLVTIIAVGYLLMARKPRLAALLAACALGTVIWMNVLKRIYERARPTVVTQIDPPGGLSFPSGHSMISAALYLTLAVLVARTLPERRMQRFVVAIGATLAMLVGVTRMYLGVHYPSDVVGGWTVGVTWALACGVVARRLGTRGEVETTGAT
ncbi:MAG TPA: phosphatase PAP2 family protein [Kofleriaceae bacterium]|nr:phosphatase PAP2 family protein [Kofleriaceae bacterium]